MRDKGTFSLRFFISFFLLIAMMCSLFVERQRNLESQREIARLKLLVEKSFPIGFTDFEFQIRLHLSDFAHFSKVEMTRYNRDKDYYTADLYWYDRDTNKSIVDSCLFRGDRKGTYTCDLLVNPHAAYEDEIAEFKSIIVRETLAQGDYLKANTKRK